MLHCNVITFLRYYITESYNRLKMNVSTFLPTLSKEYAVNRMFPFF